MSDERDAFGNPVARPVAYDPADGSDARQAPTLAVIALISGTVGFFVIPLFSSIGAIALGIKARRDMPPGKPTRMATAAIVTGWIGVAIWVIAVVAFVVLVVAFADDASS